MQEIQDHLPSTGALITEPLTLAQVAKLATTAAQARAL